MNEKYDLAELKNNDLGKKMTSEKGYQYNFYEDKNGKKNNEELFCKVCAEQAPIFYELTRTDSNGTEPIVEGKFCSHYCCAFAYLAQATKEDEHAAQQIETTIKTRIKTLKNADSSAQAKTLQELLSVERTRAMLNKVELEYAKDQPMNQRIDKYFNDVEMQDFAVTSKKADEGENFKCLECHHSNPGAKQDVTQTQFEIKDTTSSSRKLLATVTHCGNIECLLASVLSIPEIKELNSKGAQPINEDTRANPTFRLLNITTSWRVAATNLKTKLWLQEAMNKINEIEDLVLQKRKEICANETSTNEDIAKVSEAVRHVRELTDQQSTMKSA